MKRGWILLGCALAGTACSKKENTGTVVGPGLTAVPAVNVDGGSPPSNDKPASPVTATFIDLSEAGAPVKFVACEELAVVVASGHATSLGESLGEGDVLVAQGSGGFDVKGEGLALLAAIRPHVCDAGDKGPIVKHVVRASAAPALTFAKGKMVAHLDVGSDVSPFGYIGRLEGTAPVAEHTHEGVWEVLCAVQASGTFVLNGREQHVGPRTVLTVPPNIPHSWKPDEGSKLVAIQIYSPPGPEQRFKKLAAESAGAAALDGGAKKK